TLNKRVIQMEKGIVIRDDSKGQYEFTEKVDKTAVKDALTEADTEIPESKSTFKVTISSKTEGKEETDTSNEETSTEEVKNGLMQPKIEKRGLFAKFFGGGTPTPQQTLEVPEDNNKDDFEDSNN